VRSVISDCLVPLRERHVALLTLAEIAKGAISRPFVSISMSGAAAGEDENGRIIRWCDNAALPLTSKA
jgi:hypothetical protein